MRSNCGGNLSSDVLHQCSEFALYTLVQKNLFFSTETINHCFRNR